MRVILLERVGRLGQMGDVVRVKDGYARNFLLPQGKALRATDDNMEQFKNPTASISKRAISSSRARLRRLRPSSMGSGSSPSARQEIPGSSTAR